MTLCKKDLKSFCPSLSTTMVPSVVTHFFHLLFHFYFIISFNIFIGVNPPAMQETSVQFLGWEDPLEKG